MIASYKRKSNIAAIVFLASGGAFGALAILVPSLATPYNSHQDLWATKTLETVFLYICMASFLYALWAYIRAKGRDDKWILMVFLLNMLGLLVLGLLVIVLLKDYRKDGVSIQEPPVPLPPDTLRSGQTSPR